MMQMDALRKRQAKVAEDQATKADAATEEAEQLRIRNADSLEAADDLLQPAAGATYRSPDPHPLCRSLLLLLLLSLLLPAAAVPYPPVSSSWHILSLPVCVLLLCWPFFFSLLCHSLVPSVALLSVVWLAERGLQVLMVRATPVRELLHQTAREKARTRAATAAWRAMTSLRCDS